MCFLGTYESHFQVQPQRKNSVSKAYTTAELSNIPLIIACPESIEVSSSLGTSSAIREEKATKDLMFSPTSKLVL